MQRVCVWRVGAVLRTLTPSSLPRRDAHRCAVVVVASCRAASTHSATLQQQPQQQQRSDDDEDASTSQAACTTLTTTTTTTTSSSSDADATAWPEPTLADLDRSIPQVDCVFMASLTRHRRMRRDAFLRDKAEVKAKVQQLTRQHASSVLDGAALHHVGQLDSTTRAVRVTSAGDRIDDSGSSSGGAVAMVASGSDSSGSDGSVSADACAPVLASDEVLHQLSADERDVLYGTRPEYDDGFVLLDCRTVNEVTSWGLIEGAKVLPAHELVDAFRASPEDFLRDYGFAKPTPAQCIVCYCQYGPRSLMAAQILSWMGYVNVLHFRDGYYEWGKQYNLLLRRWMEHDKTSGNELRRLAAFTAGLELQRAIAPEFNALPMQEAARYRLDTTRSRGTLRIGDGVRAAAYAALERLTRDTEAALLPDTTSTSLPQQQQQQLTMSHKGKAGEGSCTRDGSGDEPASTVTSATPASPLTDFLQHATGYTMS